MLCFYTQTLDILFFYWFIPLITTFPMIGWFIEMAEHFPIIHNQKEIEKSWNRFGNKLELFFTGMHSENYHLVHHLMPSIPFWNLVKAHKIMLKDEEYKKLNKNMGGIFLLQIQALPFGIKSFSIIRAIRKDSIVKNSKAIFYATLAALCNAFVGIFSVLLFKENFTSFEVAFLKCLLAGLIIFIALYFLKKLKDFLLLIKQHFKALLLCAFFGFFMLYHFESAAYADMSVASVVFTLFSSSLLCAFLCQCLYQKRFFNAKEIISLILAFIGLILIFISEGGSLEDFNLNFQNLSFLLALALLPTIGGFYCTIKALSLTSANSVALIELSEPIFAMILAFALLAQSPNLSQILGGLCILVAIIFHELSPQSLKKPPPVQHTKDDD